MAIAKQKQGKYEEAEVLHRKALQICQGLMKLWENEADATNPMEAPTTSRQHPHYHIFLYNVCLAIARQGLMEEMRSIRYQYRDELTKAERQFRRIETRLERDREEESLYFLAQQRRTDGGRTMYQSQWWIENQSEIETASYRLGALVEPVEPNMEENRSLIDSTIGASVLTIDEGCEEPSSTMIDVSARNDAEAVTPISNSNVMKDKRTLTGLPILSRIRTGFRRSIQK